MDGKLDEILAGLRSLERRVRRIEDLDDNNINVDKKFAKVSKFSDVIYYYIYTYFLYILEYS